MENGGFLDELKRKCSKPSKKKSIDIVSFMKSVSQDDEIQLNSAIAEDDLGAIRYKEKYQINILTSFKGT